MKKHESIMRRVRFIEEKHGIKYAKPDGKLFKGLKVLYTLVWIYTLGINLIYLAGYSLYLTAESLNMNEEKLHNGIITVGIGTLVIIIGFVLLCTRLKVTGAAVSLVPLPLLAVHLGRELSDDLGFLGFKASYYWRHLVPMAVMLILLVGMLVIVLRARYKTNSQYKSIVENLYSTYHTIDADGNTPEITEEQWEEFLKNYDPRVRDYKKQFALQADEAESKESGETAK